MSDSQDELMSLRMRENELYAEFHRRIVAPDSYWHFNYGPIHIRARMPSSRIAGLFTTFCVLTFVAGAVLTLTSTARELGIAMVVGSIFTLGSFLIQYWTLQVQSERDAFVALEHEKNRETIQRLAKSLSEVTQRMEELDQMKNSGT